MKEFIDKLIERLGEEKQACHINAEVYTERKIGKIIEIVTELAEEYKDKPSDEWETIYDKVCSLEKKYANDGNVESVNDCIKLENLLQYFKEELQSAEEYKLFGNSEQVKGGWIPVLERLPKEDERILCLHSDGFIDCGVLIGETWCCDMDEYAVIRDDIHAWMPLPTLPAPYTEGE